MKGVSMKQTKGKNRKKSTKKVQKNTLRVRSMGAARYDIWQ